MIQWDDNNKQILTKQCRQCPESYFAPYRSDLPHVGCCSHSPAFTLFEIYKMVKNDSMDFFLEKILNNPKAVVEDYKITIPANVSSLYDQIDKVGLSGIEEEDLRLQFSVCQFFVLGTGCGLHPAFKNQACRSFICSAVEEQLDSKQQENLKSYVSEIRTEVDQFNRKHEAELHAWGWTFQHHMQDILRYLASVEACIPN